VSVQSILSELWQSQRRVKLNFVTELCAYSASSKGWDICKTEGIPLENHWESIYLKEQTWALSLLYFLGPILSGFDKNDIILGSPTFTFPPFDLDHSPKSHCNQVLSVPWCWNGPVLVGWSDLTLGGKRLTAVCLCQDPFNHIQPIRQPEEGLRSGLPEVYLWSSSCQVLAIISKHTGPTLFR
jgi:hypothetical protein